jgi:hypothetical protein
MRVSRPGRPALAGSLLIRNVEVQAAACRDRVDQGLQLGGGGALDHAVHQRCSTVQGESQTRAARNARGQDGAGRGRAAGLTETGQFLGTLHYVVPEQIMWGSEIRFGMSCEVVTQRCSPRGRVHGETKTEPVTAHPRPPRDGGPGRSFVSIEQIVHLVGHASTRTTEIDRRELRPAITTGAEITDMLFTGRSPH